MTDKKSLLPPTSTALERAVEQATARIADIPIDLPAYAWNPMICPEGHLPFMAWGLSVDEWDENWPIHIRRHRVATALEIQRRKGTVKSVRDVVASFGGGVAIREWWETIPKGEPHTFSLVLNLNQAGAPATADFVDQVIAEVHRTKPARSHFTFTQGLTASARIGLVAVARPVISARLMCSVPVSSTRQLSPHSDGSLFSDGSAYAGAIY